ncbi:hypothetical protein Q757_04475 [Oenococcus alcoholitolerans]|uniref:HTH LytTR-type domain-containing protein n=1 Tax=Oenococcus alcoholitolerans TaxID=931074 RepID=A0ABR4XRU5_9LACO|nr:hypothetical protein Q757_04475 [Oenococcus alcoholitolerans]
MQLAFYRQGREYYLSVDDFLFFETEGRQVYAHTVDRIYVTKYRLYELEKILTSNFVRASKSAILNVDKVWSLTHSLSNNLIEFNGSQKQIYVSRRYYHAVKEKLEGRGIEHE